MKNIGLLAKRECRMKWSIFYLQIIHDEGKHIKGIQFILGKMNYYTAVSYQMDEKIQLQVIGKRNSLDA